MRRTRRAGRRCRCRAGRKGTRRRRHRRRRKHHGRRRKGGYSSYMLGQAAGPYGGSGTRGLMNECWSWPGVVSCPRKGGRRKTIRKKRRRGGWRQLRVRNPGMHRIAPGSR